jgi:hypothetical protein
MKKLLFILPVIFFSLVVNAQGTQTEDEVYVGRKFGNYRSADTRPIDGQQTITGVVTRGAAGNGVQDSLKDGRGGLSLFNLKKADGTVLTIGTRDNGFTVPRTIEGHTISIQGKDAGQISGRKRRDFQFAATGILILD